MKRLRKLHQKVARLVEQEAMKNYRFYGDRRGEFSRGINEDPADVRKAGYYHGVSHGASKMDLLDYYYPEDTQLMYFKKHEQYKEEQEGGLNKRYYIPYNEETAHLVGETDDYEGDEIEKIIKECKLTEGKLD